MKFKVGISAILAIAVVAVVGATAALSAIDLPPGPNRELVYGQCRTCHDLQYLVESAGMPRDAWDDLLDSMKQYGLRIPDEQRGKILNYLGTYLGPNPPKPGTPAMDLPAGPNRELVYGQCRTCHDLRYLVESKGMPRQSWDELLDSMKHYGLRIPQEQRSAILDYLGTYLGPNPPEPGAAGRTASAVNGEVVFKEQCVSCHQATGKGLAKQFPPLAGNSDLFLARDFPVRVLLHGLEGKIEVGGKPFNSVMPPFDHLSDEQIAAVLHYVRSAWGNADLMPKDFQEIAAHDVATARQQEMTSAQVWNYRSSLK
jgi:mono/diheme cytochrome c family protein